MARAVIAIVRLVRPWYAWSRTSTASRPVARRAIFTAFSTASAPELTSTDRLAWSPGVSRASASQTATYSSYGLIMKHVCVKSSACAPTAAATSGALAPTDVTAIPEPRSTNTLPSTSSITAPDARET